MSIAWRPSAEDALRAWGFDPDRLAMLAGDASSRRYARGPDPSGRSVVIMDCGEPIPETTDGADPFKFTRWQTRYRDLGIRVPEILAECRPAGLLLLEDLGDETLQARVEARGAAACAAEYGQAATWARILRDEGPGRHDPATDPDEDPLVADRLALEMDLFLAHAARVPAPPPAAAGPSPQPPLERARIALDGAREPAIADARAALHRLCADAHAAGALAPCHRDFHARNLLMVAGDDGRDEVAVIDFQDTRRGPRAYDLVSLTQDPYVTLPTDLVATLTESLRPRNADPIAWDREARLVAGQRLIKAAGSYAFLSREGGRVEYDRWLAPALARAHERLSLWPARDATWDALRRAGAIPGGG